MQVLELDSRNVKALYRRAQAYIQLVDLDLAELDIKKALEIDPDNRSVSLSIDAKRSFSQAAAAYHDVRLSDETSMYVLLMLMWDLSVY